MKTLLEERINQAMENKKEDINSFIWKGPKKLDVDGQYKQEEFLLVEASPIKLRECYEHCTKMLFNEDNKNPGRYIVLELIDKQKEKCGVELFLRYLEKEHQITRRSLIDMISTFVSNNREVFKDSIPQLQHMFSSIPKEYETLPLKLILDGCLDRLGTLDKKHITRTFILKQGLWLTSSEMLSFPTKDVKERLEIIKEQLGIKEVENLYINSKGINYTQMRAMLNLKPHKKYMDLTTAQLETLRYRILFTLEEAVKIHISSWEERMRQIEKIADEKNIQLV